MNPQFTCKHSQSCCVSLVAETTRLLLDGPASAEAQALAVSLTVTRSDTLFMENHAECCIRPLKSGCLQKLPLAGRRQYWLQDFSTLSDQYESLSATRRAGHSGELPAVLDAGSLSRRGLCKSFLLWRSDSLGPWRTSSASALLHGICSPVHWPVDKKAEQQSEKHLCTHQLLGVLHGRF